jgi:hypothetical protein
MALFRRVSTPFGGAYASTPPFKSYGVRFGEAWKGMRWRLEISTPLRTFSKLTTPEEVTLLVYQTIFFLVVEMSTFIRRSLTDGSNCDSSSNYAARPRLDRRHHILRKMIGDGKSKLRQPPPQRRARVQVCLVIFFW